MSNDIQEHRIKYFELFREYIPNSTLVHAHVPRTGGVSTSSVLKKYLKRCFSLRWEPELKPASWAEFLAMSERGPFDLCTGHIPYDYLQSSDAFSKYNCFAFLREPLDRLISAYNYNINIAPYREAFALDYPTFLKYAMDDEQSNLMSKALIDQCIDYDNTIELIKEKYVFIGIHEFFNISHSLLYHLIGKEYKHPPRLNTSTGSASRQLLSSEETDAFINQNRSDYAVYEYFRTHLLASLDTDVAILIQDVALHSVS